MLELVMKCEVCRELLEEYVDGELSAEQELYAGYDRELQVPAELWSAISSQIIPVANHSNVWARIAAVLVLAIGLGSVSLLSRKSESIASIELPEQRPVLVKVDFLAAKPKTQIKR